MSDTNPHIRHRVQMPNGEHVEVVYGDHLRDSHAGADSERPYASDSCAQTDLASASDPASRPDLVYEPEASLGGQAGCVPQALHVCFNCAGELVYPLDWSEEGANYWRILLRCPECEARREGVFEQAVVELLDDELDRASGTLLSDLKRITHANMTDEVEFFVRALRADLVVPSDF